MGKFVIRTAKNGYKFDLRAGNGEVIATSEVYVNLAGCRNGIESVRRCAPTANLEDQTTENFEKKTNPKFELYPDKAGEYRFRLKATNGQIIAVSEGYKGWDGCMNGIDSVRRNAATAEITEEKP